MFLSSLLPASLTWSSLAGLALLALVVLMVPAYLATWLVPWWQSRSRHSGMRKRSVPPARSS